MFSAASGFTNGFGTTGQEALLSKNPGKFSAFWPLSTLLQKVSGYSHHRLSQGTLVLFVDFFFSSMPQGTRDTSSPTQDRTYILLAVEVGSVASQPLDCHRSPPLGQFLSHLICLTNDPSICWSCFSHCTLSLCTFRLLQTKQQIQGPYSSGVRTRSLSLPSLG